MEGEAQRNAEFQDSIPERGALIELSDEIPAEAREQLKELPANPAGKYMIYGTRTKGDGKHILFIGAYNPTPNIWRDFDPNWFPYEDGPYQGIVGVLVDAVKKVDTSKSATLYEFKRPDTK